MLARAGLRRVYHVAETVQAMEGTRCCGYHGSWYADTMCITSLRALFKSRKDERAT